jgi:ABC-type glutathione transport system ATPase component
MDPILSLQRLTKSFQVRGSKEPLLVVDDVSLEVHAGEIVALVGESGSGKSTIARMALALEQPTSGRVLLHGEDLHALSPAELRVRRREVQPIFQNYSASFNPRRRIDSLLQQASRNQDGDREAQAARSADLLEQVGLTPGRQILTRYPRQLSGGQQQRLAVARALAMEPSVIVADEPLSGADVSIRGQMLNLFEEVQARTSVGILMISHDVSTVRALADRVYVLHHGRVVESGTPDPVLTDPTHEYTRQLLAAVPVL